MKYRSTLSISLLLVMLSLSPYAFGQKKSETKLYKKILKADTKEEYKAFLAKYPDSFYKEQIQHKIDSIIKVENTTSFTPEQARKVFESYMGETSENLLIKPFKVNGVEHIIAAGIRLGNDSRYKTRITLLRSNDAANWTKAYSSEQEIYTQGGVELSEMISTDLEEVTIGNGRNFSFAYRNYSKKIDQRSKWINNNEEIVYNLFSLPEMTLYNAMFAGERTGEMIEGFCMESAQSGKASQVVPQMAYLIGKIKEEKLFKPLSQARYADRKAIETWYSKNPIGSQNLDYVALNPDVNEIVTLFEKDEYIEKSKDFSAAYIKHMGTTIVCVYANQTKQHLMVWCEPTPGEKEKDAKVLNTLYFEKPNILVLYYYLGNKTIKERINLTAKTKN